MFSETFDVRLINLSDLIFDLSPLRSINKSENNLRLTFHFLKNIVELYKVEL